MQMARKWFETVEEETGQDAELNVEGGFELNGEAALDKENGLGVAVRAATPNLGPQIPVSLDTTTSVQRAASGNVRANIGYYFRASLTASNKSLATVRREEIIDGDVVEEEDGPNSLGR